MKLVSGFSYKIQIILLQSEFMMLSLCANYVEDKKKRLAEKCLTKSKKERNRRNKMNRYIMELTDIIKDSAQLVSKF